MEQEKKVLIYAGNDLVDLLTVNRLVPEMIAMGVTPVLLFPKKPHSQNPFASVGAMKEYAFYQSDLLQKTIIPYMDSIKPVLDSAQNPRTDICYTPTQLADIYGIQVSSLADVNSKEHVKWVNDDCAVVGSISVRCMQIFKKPIIDAVSQKGFMWNAHPGKLPNYRGVIPIFRAMANGDKELQWTLHTINKGIDTGPVHATTSQAVEKGKSVFWHYNTNTRNVAAMILGNMQHFLDRQSINRIMQDLKEGEYFSYPSPEVTDAFNKAGGALIEPKDRMIRFLEKTFLGRRGSDEKELSLVIESAIEKEFGLEETPVQRAALKIVNKRDKEKKSIASFSSFPPILKTSIG